MRSNGSLAGGQHPEEGMFSAFASGHAARKMAVGATRAQKLFV